MDSIQTTLFTYKAKFDNNDKHFSTDNTLYLLFNNSECIGVGKLVIINNVIYGIPMDTADVGQFLDYHKKITHYTAITIISAKIKHQK